MSTDYHVVKIEVEVECPRRPAFTVAGRERLAFEEVIRVLDAHLDSSVAIPLSVTGQGIDASRRTR